MTKELATLAGGCFWCLEAIFDDLKGVERVISGYSGGTVDHPTYQEVCTGNTGHAEVVQIEFDPEEVTFRDLLNIFFSIHDPTTLNRQGPDVGTQYRSGIFFHSLDQQRDAEAIIQEVTADRLWKDPVVTEVTPFEKFYPAEDYHQDYFKRNPTQGYCRAIIAPKVLKFRKEYLEKLKS